jgi:hypothetical protein
VLATLGFCVLCGVTAGGIFVFDLFLLFIGAVLYDDASVQSPGSSTMELSSSWVLAWPRADFELLRDGGGTSCPVP